MIHFYRDVTSRTNGLHGAALLALRVVAGRLFIQHGLAKFDAVLFAAGPGAPAADSALGLERASQDRAQFGDKALVGSSKA
ncbi:putative membrane protein YphA (DoxX/SURF4 family) [Streptomyces sp. SAI-208]|uniref:hypothetical protein n=1 Tax=Streptomyces sp. SAI-208 TaxID=2940550 RepID=UPI0024755702|nr:hypothetical protein [Streptomyces sp. SAI-208]MDH6604566.1 putative membrane protein YphA (DoxX/SURF4 family) [Streptomyces sp. SAI-208]